MENRRLFAVLALAALIAAVTAAAAEIPRQAPELAIALTDGKQVLLSQYKGKVVALAFILTYCSHCQKTVGFLIKDQNEFGPQGFQVLASAIEDAAPVAVPGFQRTYNPPFPVGFDNQKIAMDFLEHPSALILHMPGLVFIDRQGEICAQYEGDSPFLAEDQMEKNLRDKIAEMLKPAAPGSKKGGTGKGRTAAKKSS